jgi:hypothetical protein
LIAIPIAIHLLVRQQTRSVAYPSLRFVRETALAAFRRRAIQDAVLLMCRIAIVASAVIALAAPVFQTSWRSEAYARRTSRAIVMLDTSAHEPALEQRRDTYRSETFRRPIIADAINDAVRWLDGQPPSAREVVFVGSFHRGQVEHSDLIPIPESIGVRFQHARAPQAPRQLVMPVLMRSNGKLLRINQAVELDADATRVSTGAAAGVDDDRLRIIAAAKDQPLADAALRAALRAGVRWTMEDVRVVIVWEGAEGVPPSSSAVQRVRMPVPEPASSSATAIWNALDAAMPRVAVEPVPIPAERLTQWSRPAGPPAPGAAPQDEGDRRWLWMLALTLLGIEYLLRRDRALVAQHLEDGRVA